MGEVSCGSATRVFAHILLRLRAVAQRAPSCHSLCDTVATFAQVLLATADSMELLFAFAVSWYSPAFAHLRVYHVDFRGAYTETYLFLSLHALVFRRAARASSTPRSGPQCVDTFRHF